MKIQVIKDAFGNDAGVFVPISDWNAITRRHQDLKELVYIEPVPYKKLSKLAGKLSKQTAEAMLKHVEQSRIEWEERLNKQF